MPQTTLSSKHLYIISSSFLLYRTMFYAQYHRFSNPLPYTRALCSRCCYGNFNWKFLCACSQSLCTVITCRSNCFSRLSYILFSFKCFPQHKICALQMLFLFFYTISYSIFINFNVAYIFCGFIFNK